MTALGARALAGAAVVAAVVGLVFPYVTLRLGFGPNVSLFSTLLGFVVLTAARARGRMELHAAHAAGVAAGQTAFMGVALAAIEILRAKHGAELDMDLTPPVIFAWFASAGTLGVIAALPLRRHYIEDERLAFAAGTAAAETILALETKGGARKATALIVSIVGSCILVCLRPVGLVLRPLGVGSGMLIGLRVAVSMALGALVVRAIDAPLAPWLAASAMVAGGVTGVMFRTPSLVRAIRSVGAEQPEGTRARIGRLPLVIAAGALVALCAVDRWALGLPISLTLASVALAAPLLVVGTRVLGETNWAPVVALAAVAQAALAAIVPGCLVVTMVGGVVAGAIPSGGQHMMQSFRAAAIVGARTRDTAIAQLVGVVVGSLALSISYPLLLARFGMGEGGLASPFSVTWAAFAEAFAGGALPAGAHVAVACGAGLGVVLALLERRFGARVPSATALGMGMLVPGGIVVSVLAGSVLSRVATHVAPRATSEHGAAIASGLVAGEALAACAMAFFAAFST